MEKTEKDSWVTTTPPSVKASDHIPVNSIRQLRSLIAAQRVEYEQQLAALSLAREVALKAEGKG